MVFRIVTVNDVEGTCYLCLQDEKEQSEAVGRIYCKWLCGWIIKNTQERQRGIRTGQ
jgi:hypothetical protein